MSNQRCLTRDSNYHVDFSFLYFFEPIIALYAYFLFANYVFFVESLQLKLTLTADAANLSSNVIPSHFSEILMHHNALPLSSSSLLRQLGIGNLSSASPQGICH